GYDPSAYSMVSFGGAGGLHACSIASLLGIKKIILPEEAGLLSAFGIGKYLNHFKELKKNLSMLYIPSRMKRIKNYCRKGSQKRTLRSEA
ncbi:hydantoinase/oxoprolinase family protein, partial [Bacteroidota bacterium]